VPGESVPLGSGGQVARLGQGLGTTRKRRCFFGPRGSSNNKRGCLFWTGENASFGLEASSGLERMPLLD
jgi:hypothetical protein